MIMPLFALCALGFALAADTPPPADAVAQGLRGALLWYEGGESVKGGNEGIGVKISSATVVDGKIGKALLLERPEANRLKNPDFDALDGWIAVGNPQLCKEGGRFSPACARVTEADFLRQVATDLRVEEKSWYCLSVYAKSDTPGTTLELDVDREVVKNFPLTAQYERFAMPFQTQYTNSTITLRVRGAGAVTVDAAQLEERRSFPSSFCPKERRPTQRIEVAVSDKTLNVNEGGIAFWFQPLWIGGTGTGQNLFAWWFDANTPGAEHLILSAYPGGTLTDHDWTNRILLMRTRGRRHDCFTAKSFPLCEWTPGSWHHVAATWKANPGETPSRIALYLDGKLIQAKEAPWGEIKPPKVFYFGYCWGAYADAALDEIHVFRRMLTDDEVSYLFASKSPL